MYKDKDKQRKAVREAVCRHRAKGITVMVLHEAGVIPKEDCITIPLKPDHTIDLVRLRSMKPKPQSYNPMMVGYVPPDAE